MIMRPGHQHLLLPANPLFIWASLLVALVLNIGLSMTAWGHAAWLPDLLAIVIVFWGAHQPLRVSVGVAFVLGLAMDVHQAALLGQHALAYTVLGYLAVMMHRRLQWFGVWSQGLQLLPVFFAAELTQLGVRMLAGSAFAGWGLLAAPVIQSALWPLVTHLLLAPQRRAPNPDANRPL